MQFWPFSLKFQVCYTIIYENIVKKKYDYGISSVESD